MGKHMQPSCVRINHAIQWMFLRFGCKLLSSGIMTAVRILFMHLSKTIKIIWLFLVSLSHSWKKLITAYNCTYNLVQIWFLFLACLNECQLLSCYLDMAKFSQITLFFSFSSVAYSVMIQIASFFFFWLELNFAYFLGVFQF